MNLGTPRVSRSSQSDVQGRVDPQTDDLHAARGIITATVLGALFWVLLGLIWDMLA